MPRPDIRRAAVGDLPFLWTMLHEAANWRGSGETSLEETRADDHNARYLEGWGRSGDFGVVAEHEGEPTGAAWYRLFAAGRAGWGYIDEATPELAIGVRPEFRGTGVGTALLRALIAEASASYAALSLSVEPENPAARLYQRLGFQKVATVGDAWTMLRTSR